MKKVVMIFALTFLLVGCGNNLTCLMEEESDGATISQKIKLSFKDDKISKMKSVTTFSEQENADSMCKELEAFKSEDIEVSCSGKKVSIERKTMGSAYDENMTKDEAKELYEEMGYTCK